MDEAIFYINHGNDQRPTNAEVNPDKNESRTEPADYTPESNSEESLSNNASKAPEESTTVSTEGTNQIEENHNDEQGSAEQEIDLFENQDVSITTENNAPQVTTPHGSPKTPIKTAGAKPEAPGIFAGPEELPLPSTELLDSEPLLPN